MLKHTLTNGRCFLCADGSDVVLLNKSSFLFEMLTKQQMKTQIDKETRPGYSTMIYKKKIESGKNGVCLKSSID